MKCPQCEGPHTLSQCPNWRLLPVALHPAIEDALRGHCMMPITAWQDVIAAADRVQPANASSQQVCHGIAAPVSVPSAIETALVKAGLCADKSEASRLLAQGAVSIEGGRICRAGDTLPAGEIMLRLGRTKSALVLAAPERSGKTADDFGLHVTRIVHEIRRATSLAWRDSLIEQLLDRIDPNPAPAASSSAAPSGFPERDQSKPAEQQGMFRKFDVRRTDGSSEPGGKHYGCRYWVLDLNHDQHAPAAMQAYAADCRATHPVLADDIEAEFGAAPSVQAPPPPAPTLTDADILLTMQCGGAVRQVLLTRFVVRQCADVGHYFGVVTQTMFADIERHLTRKDAQ